MKVESLQKIFSDVERSIVDGVTTFGVIGDGPELLAIGKWQRTVAPGIDLVVYGINAGLALAAGLEFRSLRMLAEDEPEVVIVASDDDKEDVIGKAIPYLEYIPKLIVAGYGHYAFRDPLFESIRDELLVPSIANGYPYTLVHIYECLVNAARRELDGSVVEFGTFKGGTSMFLAKTVAALGQSWPVITFDTYDGFPKRRSALDMYAHEGAEFHDSAAVRAYLEPAGVQVVEGDIASTASVVAETGIVLAFVDTDNFSPASAAIAAIKEKVVPGGAIVFDHLTGVDRFRYTLGERMAARALHDDPRYFNLHATGVFLRQK